MEEILRAALAGHPDELGSSRVASAIQAVVWREGELLLDAAMGCTFFAAHQARVANPAIRPAPLTHDTPMDLASVTKPLVAATLLMQAVDMGLVAFDDPIARFVPQWAAANDSARRGATLLHLLNHSSGLPAWDKFYLRFPLNPSAEVADATRRAVIDSIARTPLEAAPGTRHCYSDLGYILLSHILEEVFADNLQTLARAQIFEPLGMQHTDYVSPVLGDQPLAHAAATEDCALRGRLVVGTVHDENTEIIGGVSGHAGVFTTARDLLLFARHLLEIDRGEGRGTVPGIVQRRTLRFCWSDEARAARDQPHPGHHLGGWDTPSGARSTAGRGFAAGRTVGHLGFTGTSLWIERDLGLIAILLTNRVYPTRQNALINPLRIAFHEAVLPAR